VELAFKRIFKLIGSEDKPIIKEEWAKIPEIMKLMKTNN